MVCPENPRMAIVRIKKSILGGSGLFSKENFDADFTILSIPLSECLSRKYIENNFKFIGNERMQIILFLAFAFNNESQFKSYVDSLPRNFNTPPFLNHDILSKTQLLQPTIAKLNKLQTEFDQISNLVDIDFNTFKIIDAIYWSRVLEIDDCKYLVPTLDSCNHSFKPNCFWKVEGENILLITNHELKADSELTISYGDKTNLELFFIHGFVDRSNPNNHLFSFMPPIIDQDEATILQKVKAINSIFKSPKISIKSPSTPKLQSIFVDLESFCIVLISIMQVEDGISFFDNECYFDGELASKEVDFVSFYQCEPRPLLELKIVVVLENVLNELKGNLITNDDLDLSQADIKDVEWLIQADMKVLDDVLDLLSNLKDGLCKIDVVVEFLKNESNF